MRRDLSNDWNRFGGGPDLADRQPMEQAVATRFAPAERATQAEVTRQHLLVRGQSLVRRFPDTIPNMTVVLNRHRQIVHANRSFLSFVRTNDPEKIIGLRPGEVVGCIHSGAASGGCGTTRFCRTCGGARAIHDSKCGMIAEEECRVTRGHHGSVDALDLRVWSSPIDVGGEVDFTSRFGEGTTFFIRVPIR